MAEKDGTQSEAVAKIDFSALELELDKELDSLFAPVMQSPAAATMAPPIEPKPNILQTGFDPTDSRPDCSDPALGLGSTTAKSDEAFDSIFAPAIQAPTASAPALPLEPGQAAGGSLDDTAGQLDFSAFSAEVDRELDSIFAPTMPTTAIADTEQKIEEKAGPPPFTLDSEGLNGNKAGDEKAALQFDLNAITSEIDKEIDAMFVPATPDPPCAAPEKPIESRVVSPQPLPEPVQEQAADVSATSFDFDAIEREIDSLFVPAKTEQEGKQEVIQPVAAFEEKVQTEQILPTAKAPDPEPVLEPAITMDSEPFPPQSATDFRIYPSDDELPRLIEVFNVAYLSLDWELSEDNLLKLQAALKDLEPYAVRSSEAVPIFKIMKAVLQRFMLKPQAVNSRLIELIRESQGLLAHILLMKGDTGQHEKERIAYLIDRFQEMRKRALAIKMEAKKSTPATDLLPDRADDIKPTASESAAPEPLAAKPAAIEPPLEEIAPELPAAEPDSPEPVPTELVIPEPLVVEVAPQEAARAPEADRSIQDSHPLRELHIWMEKSCESLSEALLVIDMEMHRIKQLEAVLNRNPSLMPLAEKLNKIRSTLEHQALSLRGEEERWRENTVSLLQIDAGQTIALSAASEEAESIPAIETAWAEPLLSEARQLDIYTFTFAGKSFAIPAHNIVKVEPATRKKILGVLKRGYVSLTDFKPLFRSIKIGVLGEWANLPVKELKSYKFEPVNYQTVQPADIVEDRYVAVFASDSERHGIIFAEETGFIEGATIHSDNSGDTFETEEGRHPFFDLNSLYSRAGLDPNGASASEEDNRSV
ncbi:MAG: hypothetical protein AB9866_10230 [Syntrophobacteraceae bacterium]